MKRLIPLIAIFIFSLFCFSCRNNDRYELHGNEQVIFMVDKKTGEVWMTVNGKWLNAGTPPKDAPKKGDRSTYLDFTKK